MDIKEIRKKVQESPDKKYTSDSGIEYTQESEDGTLHAEYNIKGIYQYTAFLMNHAKDDASQFHLSNTGDLVNINYLIRFAQLLIVDTSAKVLITGTDVVEKRIVEKDIVSEADLKGQIKAYEQILLDRRITLE